MRAEDGSLLSSVSSASSTHAFFWLDWVLMELAELSWPFSFCGDGELLDPVQPQSWLEACQQAY